MKTPLPFCMAAAIAAAAIYSTPAADAGDVIWITEVDSPNGAEFIGLLEANAQSVTHLIRTPATLTAADIDLMNASDLVIFSRQINSTTQNVQTWDTITAPMIVMTPYVLRGNRWGSDIPWFTADTLPDENPPVVVANNPNHPIFAGVNLTDDPVLGAQVSDPWHFALDRGVSLISAGVASGGSLVASSSSGAVVAAEWPSGTVAAGPRLYLAMGTREVDGGTTADSGKYNLTAAGEQVLLNAVEIFSSPDDRTDTDGDGVPDEDDAFPNDISEWLDTDGDGAGNNADTDDDNDGVEDGEDAFPLDPTESIDTDSDGIGDNADPDDDNDGISDAEDAFPHDASEWDDDDGDGIGNNADDDDDGDDIPDPRTSHIVWAAEFDSPAHQDFITLLQNAGHTVTLWIGTSQTLTETPEDFARVFNEADLVIVSRTVGSGSFNTPIWDRITAPLIALSPYITRSSHWGWFGDTGIAGDTPFWIHADMPGHPIFAGVAIDNGQTAPWHIAIDRGTSFPNSPVINSGQLLASTDLLYVAAAEWPAGAVAAGPRMILPFGSWEADTATVADAGQFNLTDTGRQVFLNAVAYYTPPLPGAGFRILTAQHDPDLGFFVITFTSDPGASYQLQRAVGNASNWSDIPAAFDTASGHEAVLADPSPPTDAPVVLYRVVRVAP